MKLLQEKSDVNIPIMTGFEHGQSVFLLANIIVSLERKGKSIKGQTILIEGTENHESVSLKRLLESYGADNVSIKNTVENDSCDIYISFSDIPEEKYMNLANGQIVFTFAKAPEEMTQKYPGVIYLDNIKNSVGTVFPQMVRAVLDTESTTVTQNMKIAQAESFATILRELPETIDYKMKAEQAEAIARSAIESGVAQKKIKTDYKAEFQALEK